ncbi:dihydrofolate reductase family protein [Macrococcus armenti]|uniref:dihydrofolate reductase family protein n=1 Tax=Macrococcus armenti TaxID=2875764 RepID=UPI001CCFE1D1|nr:dihydrofolate reductase family protein [Macrococcus armenti]UBH15635.1 dihydrofolate reductase family protein [Macrococcus armenti]UBH17996.1 dihydrofolate reductase family protein [Macrococcus armenti]UBH20261.1 dihydrofolate reductase family protein [Macrococcus armenti]
MRQLTLFLHSSLDGYAEGPNGAMDIGFIAYNEELEQFANKVLSTADTVLWGRQTYEMMYGYWPEMMNNPEASEHAQNHANWIHNVQKVICSTTLQSADWHNSTLLKGDIITKINELKQQDGEDIVILGSPRLAHYLMAPQLIDSIKLTVSPFVVGSVLPVFKNFSQSLKLMSSETFSTGALGLHYDIINKA